MSLPTCLSDFKGDWALTRTIRDARAGHDVHAEGIARLYQGEDGLVYDEEVSLRIPGQPAMKGTRRYFWRDSDDGIAVYFEDGRFFHTLKLGTPQATDHHDCAPDSYDALYDFGQWPVWNVRWIVAGPRKSYEMDTKYALR